MWIDILQLLANVAQVLSFLWVIIFGGKSVFEIVKKPRPQQPAQPQYSSRRIRWFIYTGIGIVLLVFFHLAPTIFLPLIASSSPQALYDQATNGSPLLDDPLNGQYVNNWQGQPNGCVFTEGAYHIYATNAVTECYAQTTNFSNMAFQVQITILHGDGGGLIFGYNGQNSTEYRFNVRSDGLYDLSHANSPVLGHATSHSIISGLNRNNLLTVIVEEQNIYFYINKQFIVQTSILNGTIASGSIGLFASSAGLLTEVIFSNLKIWKL